jgi:LysR family transcriptional regulator, mexEF-oprN operon transcriptional activator
MANQPFNLGTFDLNLLRTFVALMEERSTVLAARRLFLSQPTVSGALSRLRVLLSDEILIRNGRALEPTARAVEFLALIKPHLDGLSVALTEGVLFDPLEDEKVFRFGCTDAVALAALPILSTKLRTLAPRCSLVVRIGDYRVLPGMLVSGEISTTLAYLRKDPPATTKVKVMRHSPWVVVRDAAQPALEGLDDFCSRSHALVTPLGDLAGFVDEQLEKANLSRRIVIGLSSFSLLLAVLPGSDLVATVPDFVAEQLRRIAGLSIDPCPVAVPLVTNTLAWRAVVDRDPAERWFREQVIQAFNAPNTQDS